jgi:hypothetical protein
MREGSNLRIGMKNEPIALITDHPFIRRQFGRLGFVR